MTTRLLQALDVYREVPLDEGDVVLLLDDEVCLELPGLVASWDAPACGWLVASLSVGCARVQPAVARAAGRLQQQDVRVWQDLCAGLRREAGDDVTLLPLLVLPAAVVP